MPILVLADHDNNSLKEGTAKAVTAALKLAPEVDLLVAGDDVAALAAQAASIEGVRIILHAEGKVLGQGLAEAFEQLIVPLMANYDALVIPATAQGRNVAPRIAAKLDVAPITEVVEIVARNQFVRPIYAGNALEKIETSDSRQVITIRPTAFAAAGSGGTAKVEQIEARFGTLRTRFIDQSIVQSERPELAGARIIVSGGRALGSANEFRAVIEPLADLLGAAVGASRAAVDAGYAPNDYQVGQTGKVVAPDLYIAIGISGAIQHLAGMKDSKTIVAINKDPDAPIFQIADFGLVADYKTAVPELMNALSG